LQQLFRNPDLPLGYDASEDPVSSNQEVGVELSLPVTQSFQWINNAMAMAAWRFLISYLGPSSDELRLSGEVSLDVSWQRSPPNFSISLTCKAQKMTSQNLVVSYVGTLAIA